MKNKQSSLIFITGNASKLEEAKKFIPTIVGKDFDLLEIQETDAQKIIEAKLIEAQKVEKGEYIVEDTSLYIDGMKGLPGPLIKWFLQSMGVEGVAKIAGLYGEAGKVVTMIGYSDGIGDIQFFKGEIKGKIVPPKGEGGFGWDVIFQPEGEKETFGEMTREKKNTMSMRKIAFQKLAEYIGK